MPKEDAGVLALVVQLQLQHESPGRTEKWLAKLESIDPTPLRALALKAQATFNLDGKADMAGLIEPKATQLEAAAKSPEEKTQLAAAVGDLYFGFKRDADAERWYRKELRQDPKRYPPVVKALQRQGRIKDSIAVCEQAIHTDQTVQPYLLLASVLIEGKPTPAHFEAAEPMFRAAIKTYESDPRLLYALGLVRVMQKRDADSITLFRRVVAASPRSIPALNNLAMLLADIPLERPEALKLIDQAIDFAGEDASLTVRPLLSTRGA
jgi:tetratricopeptide (TPR) repeat protein